MINTSTSNSGGKAGITQSASEGILSNHPDGYLVQYMPSAGAKTMIVRIWVPQGSAAPGKEFDHETHVAVTADPKHDRLMFAGRQQQAQ